MRVIIWCYILRPYNKKTPFGKCLIEEICLGRDISYMQDQFYGAQPTSAKGDYTLLLSEFKKNLTNSLSEEASRILTCKMDI